MNRPSWDDSLMKMTAVVAERSTCKKHYVGAIIAHGKRIIAIGSNEAPKGTKDCLELRCLRNELKIPSGTKHEICRAVHAEQNAIIQGAYHGISVKGATMYCTLPPCNICAKMIVNAGINIFVTYGNYPDKEAMKTLKEGGVTFLQTTKPNNYIEFKD